MSCCGNDTYNLFSSNGQHGEKYQYDPDFKGPKTRRSPSDVYWLVAFAVFTLAWLSMGICVLLYDPSNDHAKIHLAVLDDIPTPRSESEIFEYLKKTAWCYSTTILIATVICFILIYVMRRVATPVVWFSIFLLLAALCATAIGGFVIFANAPADDAGAGLGIGIGFSIVTIIAAIAVYYCRRKVAVAIALIKEGSKAVASSYSTVLFPIIPLIFQIGIFAMWASVLVNIQFYGTEGDNEIQLALHILNFVGAFWAFLFIDAFEQMVQAHTFSTWYWTFEKQSLPFFTLSTAIQHTARFHLGTVALGSLIILIGQVVCFIIKSIMRHRLLRVFSLCCNISEIVERFLQFLNKNTYIMVAIHGHPFCQSMREAFNLLMRNIASVYVTSRVTSLQFTVLNIAISASMGGLTYLLLPAHDMQKDLIIYPILVAVIGSSIVAATFLGVYSMAIDTLFLCFLEDCERNDGTDTRPYYMSAELMKVLHKSSENLLPPPYEQAV